MSMLCGLKGGVFLLLMIKNTGCRKASCLIFHLSMCLPLPDVHTTTQHGVLSWPVSLSTSSYQTKGLNTGNMHPVLLVTD